MEWFYSDSRQRLGPVDEPEFRALLTEGRVTADTLVWRSGMPGWQSYGQAAGTFADESYPEPKLACSHCWDAFPADEVIVLDTTRVCGPCKPIAIQRIREGVRWAATLEYAGFWIRVGAKLLDGLLLFAVNMVLGALTALVGVVGGEIAEVIATVAILPFQLALPIAYQTYLVGRYGATLGKMVCGLRVVRSEGQSLTYLRAFGRCFAEYVSAFTLYIGYLIAAFDDQKRTLHDHLCDTRVVRTRQ